MVLNQDIEHVKGIGPKRGAVLREEAGISTIEDLMYYAPRRYLDRSTLLSISECRAGQEVTVTGKVIETIIERRGRSLLRVIISDGTDSLAGVFFGGIQYYQKLFSPGENVLFSGKIDNFRGLKQIVHPDYDFFDESPSESVHTGRIIPMYPSGEKLKKAGFSSRVFRKLIHSALEEVFVNVEDPLPKELISQHGFLSLAESLREIHFPQSFEALSHARIRLAYNELFFLQYYLALSRGLLRSKITRDKTPLDKTYYNQFISALPFELTSDQQNAIKEISDDLANPFPMNRLLQGDVGSGKTVVALAGCLHTSAWKLQSAVMAPTEILAVQHHKTFTQFIPTGVRIALLTGSTPAKEKKRIAEDTAAGNIDILIGTHALIEDRVQFKNLRLIVIDEQHRFGVNQRALLHQKGNSPDLLVMTATPIPRSLTLTLYGDLDISLIREKPKGRLPVKTLILSEDREKGLYTSMEKYISEGRQCYYILPLINESDKSGLASAVQMYEKFSITVFPHRKVALLHGKMNSGEKDDVMNRFKTGEIDILVSTTVIEVGIDVANATVMIIHHPERFGLSQLHQLRGRVGRGMHQSFCILFHPKNISSETKDRLSVLENNDDGFAIAEKDLSIRGAGDFLGTRQHGESSIFEFADIVRDFSLLESAKKDAECIIEKISDLEHEINEIKIRHADTRYVTGTRLTKVLSLIS